MKCKKCGREYPEYARFCVKCGIPLEAVILEATPKEEDLDIAKEKQQLKQEPIEETVTNSEPVVEQVKEATPEIEESTIEETPQEEVTEEPQAEAQEESSMNEEEPIQENNEKIEEEPKKEENIEKETENSGENAEETPKEEVKEVNNRTANETTSSPSDALSVSTKFSLARSVLMYAILGGSTLVLFIMGMTLGWSALMFIPLAGIGASILFYLREINKIEINEESLQAWNNQRANNKVFKEPITDPSKTGAKLQYWHTLPKPNKYLYASLSALMMLLMLLSLIGATVKSATKNTSSNNGGGTSEKTYKYDYKGYYPDASYVVKYDKWANTLISTGELVTHADFDPNKNCFFGIMAAYTDESDLNEFISLVPSYGYTLTDTGTTTVHDQSGNLIEEWPVWYYESYWGPETTWHKNKYWATLKVAYQGYEKRYKVHKTWMEYMFTSYSD